MEEKSLHASHIAISTVLTSLDPAKAKVATFSLYMGSHNYELYDFKRFNGDVKWPTHSSAGDFEINGSVGVQLPESQEQLSANPVQQEELLSIIATLLNGYAGATFLLGDTSEQFSILRCILMMRGYSVPSAAHNALQLRSLEWFLPRSFLTEREIEFKPFIDYHYRNIATEAEYVYRMFMHLMPYRKKQPTCYLFADETTSQTPSDDLQAETEVPDSPSE